MNLIYIRIFLFGTYFMSHCDKTAAHFKHYFSGSIYHNKNDRKQPDLLLNSI